MGRKKKIFKLNDKMRCLNCSKEKEVKYFIKYKSRLGHTLFRKKCSECWNKFIREYRKENNWKKKSREYDLKKNYGITFDKYLEMVKEQNNQCAISLKTPKKLYVDHNHKLKMVRGLLCLNCNCGIGYFKDNPLFLKKAQEYLVKTKIPDNTLNREIKHN